jgi:hypothetical protein
MDKPIKPDSVLKYYFFILDKETAHDNSKARGKDGKGLRVWPLVDEGKEKC